MRNTQRRGGHVGSDEAQQQLLLLCRRLLLRRLLLRQQGGVRDGMRPDRAACASQTALAPLLPHRPPHIRLMSKRRLFICVFTTRRHTKTQNVTEHNPAPSPSGPRSRAVPDLKRYSPDIHTKTSPMQRELVATHNAPDGWRTAVRVRPSRGAGHLLQSRAAEWHRPSRAVAAVGPILC